MSKPEQIELFPMPWSEASSDGQPDAAHRMHQELKGTAAKPAVLIAADGYSSFLDMRESMFTKEQYDTIAAQMSELGLVVMREISKQPAPDDMADEQEAETLFLPHLINFTFMMLAVVASKAVPEGTHAERYAWAFNLVRSWASYGVFHAASKAGVNAEQVRDLQAMEVIADPPPMGIVASLVDTKRKMQKEADERGVDIQTVTREYMERIMGETDDADDRTTMAF